MNTIISVRFAFGERENNTKFLIAQSRLAIEVWCSPFDRGPGIEDMSVTSQAPNNGKQTISAELYE